MSCQQQPPVLPGAPLLFLPESLSPGSSPASGAVSGGPAEAPWGKTEQRSRPALLLSLCAPGTRLPEPSTCRTERQRACG